MSDMDELAMSDMDELACALARMSTEVTREGSEVTVTLRSGAVIIVDADRGGSPVWLSVPPSISWQDAMLLGMTVATIAGISAPPISNERIVGVLRMLTDSKAAADATAMAVHAALEAARAES